METVMETASAPAHVLHILDATGDTKIIWDAGMPAEVDNARATFEKLRRNGYVAYSVAKGGEKGEVLRSFDPAAERIILAPQTVGG
jgi:hypothetical protein